LFTSTPTARFVTFQTTPVLPWYHLKAIPCQYSKQLQQQQVQNIELMQCSRVKKATSCYLCQPMHRLSPWLLLEEGINCSVPLLLLLGG
jgi:hypothetical protein